MDRVQQQMAEYVPAQGCARDRDWRIMEISDEAIHMEEIDSNMKSDQSEFELIDKKRKMKQKIE